MEKTQSAGLQAVPEPTARNRTPWSEVLGAGYVRVFRQANGRWRAYSEQTRLRGIGATEADAIAAYCRAFDRRRGLRPRRTSRRPVVARPCR